MNSSLEQTWLPCPTPKDLQAIFYHNNDDDDDDDDDDENGYQRETAFKSVTR